MTQGTGPDAAPRKPSGQPPHVLVAWTAEAIQDVRSDHLPRAGQLGGILQTQANAWESEALAQTFHALLVATRELDLGALAPLAWWQRVWFWRRRSTQKFQAGYQAMLASAGIARRQQGELAQAWRRVASLTRRAVVEMELEHRAMASLIDDAVHWLAELTQHLMAEPVPGRQERVREWALAAQRATLDLKQLHTIDDLVGEAVLVGRTLLERRSGWLDQLRQVLEAFEREWCPQMGLLALGAVGGGKPQGLAAAADVHARLLDGFERADSAVAALKIEAQGLALLLARLEKALEQPDNDESPAA